MSTIVYWFKVFGFGLAVEKPLIVLYGDGVSVRRWMLCGKLSVCSTREMRDGQHGIIQLYARG